MPRAARQPLVHYGWPFLLAGLLLVAATVLLPAQDDLNTARWQRDKALAAERHARERRDRHQTALHALLNGDPVVTERLRVSMLGERAPADQRLLPTAVDADILFRGLEPPPPQEPARAEIHSVLADWSRGDRSRLWLIAGAALLILIGLLPAGEDAADTAGDEA